MLATRLLQKAEGVVTAVCLGVLAMAGLLNIPFGVESQLVVRAFDFDENMNLGLVMQAVRDNSLSPNGFYNYGFLYYETGWALARVFAFLGDDTNPKFLSLLMRLVSFCSYLGCIWLVGKLAAVLRLRRSFVFAGMIFFAALPEIYQRSQMITADLLQLVLLITSVWIAARWQDPRGVIASAFAAGMAFGTKYAGIFFLPFIPIPFFLRGLGEGRTLREVVRRCWLPVAAMLPAFLAGWLIFNPTVPGNWKTFRAILEWEHGAVATGWGKVERPDLRLWIPVIFSQFSALELSLLLGGAAITAFLGVRALRSRDRWRQVFAGAPSRVLIMMGGYLAFTVVYVALTVRMRNPRYLFFILPMLVLTAFAGFDRLCERIPAALRLLCGAVPLAIAAAMTVHTVRTASAATRRDSGAVMQAVDFLYRCYDTRVRVLYEWYTYVPFTFRNQAFVDGVTPEAIARFHPDLLILSRDHTGRWAWKERGTSFSDLRFVTDPSYGELAESKKAFLQNLFGPESAWEVVWEADEEVILQEKHFAGERRCR